MTFFITFFRCDSENGYTLLFHLYKGKDDDLAKKGGIGERVVMTLAAPYLNKGYHIYCDNFFFFSFTGLRITPPQHVHDWHLPGKEEGRPSYNQGSNEEVAHPTRSLRLRLRGRLQRQQVAARGPLLFLDGQKSCGPYQHHNSP